MSNLQETVSSLKIEVARRIQPESREAIIRGLREFNAHYLGNYQWTDLDVYVHDLEGRVVGGLVGEFALGWFSIHILWVAEELRGLGVGTNILKVAEQAAIESSCHSAILDTMREAPHSTCKVSVGMNSILDCNDLNCNTTAI